MSRYFEKFIFLFNYTIHIETRKGTHTRNIYIHRGRNEVKDGICVYSIEGERAARIKIDAVDSREALLYTSIRDAINYEPFSHTYLSP